MEGWKDGGWWRRGMSETMNLSDASPAIWDSPVESFFFRSLGSEQHTLG